jgi:hypothetical protein
MIAKRGSMRTVREVEIQDQKIRFSEALLRVAGDVDLLAAMAMFVVDDAPEILTDLRIQISESRLEEVATTAHKLKGMLSTFETGGPVLELHDLIVAARAGRADECRRAFNKCDAGIEHLIQEIATLQNCRA